MAVDMAALTADLGAESAELYEVLSTLTATEWRQDTPAPGWTVHDQVTHLAYFDATAALSARDRERFAAEATALMEAGNDFPDRVAERFRSLSDDETFVWLQQARGCYLEVLSTLDPSISLPWYGPPMSAASSVTARLMETWAHGQDVVDALGLTRQPTGRLRHIAHLGVRTLGWSFQARSLPVPTDPVRVELIGPAGEMWTWGREDAADCVAGTAEDFCLLVTQRRHRSSTELAATGRTADSWLDVAQAFAGAPGPGRPSKEVGR